MKKTKKLIVLISEYVILDILSVNEIDKHNILIINGCIIRNIIRKKS